MLIKLSAGGMILSGVVTFFFGFAYTAGIHSFGYLIGMQVAISDPLSDSRQES